MRRTRATASWTRSRRAGTPSTGTGSRRSSTTRPTRRPPGARSADHTHKGPVMRVSIDPSLPGGEVRIGSGYRGGAPNVGTLERVLSAAAGVALIGYSYRRNRLRSVLIPFGTSLIARAVSGHCPVNRALGRNTAARVPARSPVASVQRGQGIKVEQSVIIDRTPGELYAFW